MSNRESSTEMAHLAGVVMNITRDEIGETGITVDQLLGYAKSLAGSVLSQRESDESTPGTHAYDLLASYAKLDAQNTEILIQLVAATVLYKLFVDEGGGRINIEFSPKDMDDMQRLFEMKGERDGLITKVAISPKAELSESWMVETEGGEDAKPQAQPKDERPVWAIRWWKDGKSYLHNMHDQSDAERQLPSYHPKPGDPAASIENRMCLHPDCPSERCNHVDDNGSRLDGN